LDKQLTVISLSFFELVFCFLLLWWRAQCYVGPAAEGRTGAAG